MGLFTLTPKKGSGVVWLCEVNGTVRNGSHASSIIEGDGISKFCFHVSELFRKEGGT